MLSLNAATKNYFLLLFLFAIAYLMLWFEYFHTFNFWSYMGFDLEFLPYRAITSFLLFIITTHFVCSMRDKFFKSINVFMLVYTMIPALIYFQFNPDIDFSAVGGSLIILACLYFASHVRLNIRPVIITGDFSTRYIIIFLFLSLLPYFLIYPMPSLSFSSDFYADIIYQIRVQYRGVDGPKIFAYYYGVLTRVILPFLIVYSLVKGSRFLLFVCLLAILYLFSLGALKSIVFGVLLSMIFFFGKDYDSKIRMILYGTIGLSIISLLETYISGTYVVNDMLVRRVFFLPVLLHEVYSNYFDSNYLYWSHTLIGQSLGFYSLDQSVSFFIGEVVMGLEGANANVGIMTEGYFSAGYLGVLVHGVILGFLFLVIRSAGFNPAYLGILLYFCYLLNTSFLLPLLATHGFFALVLISVVKFRHRRGLVA